MNSKNPKKNFFLIFLSHRLEKERKKAAVEWDKKEQKLIEDYYKKKFLEGETWKVAATPQENFIPESWTRKIRRRGPKVEYDENEKDEEGK